MKSKTMRRETSISFRFETYHNIKMIKGKDHILKCFFSDYSQKQISYVAGLGKAREKSRTDLESGKGGLRDGALSGTIE